jgi:hypothetical protein
MRLIGWECKQGNLFSLPVLIYYYIYMIKALDINLRYCIADK